MKGTERIHFESLYVSAGPVVQQDEAEDMFSCILNLDDLSMLDRVRYEKSHLQLIVQGFGRSKDRPARFPVNDNPQWPLNRIIRRNDT